MAPSGAKTGATTPAPANRADGPRCATLAAFGWAGAARESYY
jgi:hypothetical protein